MTPRSRGLKWAARAALFATAAIACAGCGRSVPSEADARAASADVSSVTSAGEPRADALAELAKDGEPAAREGMEPADAGTQPTEASEKATPVNSIAASAETDLYQFSIEGVADCNHAADGGTTVIVGVRVKVQAKTVRLFVSPHDVKLARRGIIFTSAPPDIPAACAPRLKPAQLLPGHALSGFVLFEVPSASSGQFVVRYQPTVWGGAPGVELPISGATARDSRGAFSPPR